MIKNRLKEFLAAENIKHGDFAKDVGVSYTTLSRIINGKNMPQLLIALKIAKRLEKHVDEIWVLIDGGTLDR